MAFGRNLTRDQCQGQTDDDPDNTAKLPSPSHRAGETEACEGGDESLWDMDSAQSGGGRSPNTKIQGSRTNPTEPGSNRARRVTGDKALEHTLLESQDTQRGGQAEQSQRRAMSGTEGDSAGEAPGGGTEDTDGGSNQVDGADGLPGLQEVHREWSVRDF